MVGGKDLGVTGGVGGKALAAEAQLGLIDNQFGAKIGGTLVSAEGSVGLNVAGANVAVKGEIGLKAEAGFSIGAKGVEVKLPFISFGSALAAPSSSCSSRHTFGDSSSSQRLRTGF